MFIEILFKMLLFKGGVLIYAEQCIYIYIKMCLTAPGGEQRPPVANRWIFFYKNACLKLYKQFFVTSANCHSQETAFPAE